MYKRRWLSLSRLVPLLITVLFLLGVAGCGSSSSSLGEIPFEPSLRCGLPALPAPAGLLRHVSYEEHERIVAGAMYQAALPNNRVGHAWLNGWFVPAWEPGAGATIADTAYAIYYFPMDEYDREPWVCFSWFDPPDDWSDFYFAIANWGHNRWDWFAGPADGTAELPSFEPYQDEAGGIMVVVLLTGTEDRMLEWVRVGGRVGQWYIETVEDALISCASLAVTSYDTSRIAYHLTGTGQGYAWLVDDWQTEVAESGDLGAYCALALDSVDWPHITNVDDVAANQVYMHHNGVEWASDPPSPVASSGHGDIVLDGDNHPHICFASDDNTTLEYAYYDGSEWDGDRLLWDTGIIESQIALDSNDRPHVLTVHGDGDWMTWFWHDGEDWDHSHIFEADPTSGISFTLNDNDDLLIACFDDEDDRVIWIIDDGVWRVVMPIEGFDAAMANTSLAVSDTGPVVAYSITPTDAAGPVLRYAVHQGGDEWDIDTVTPLAAGCSSVSLALDSRDQPRLAFVEVLGLDTALRYAVLLD